MQESKIQITADSTCDLSADILKEYHILLQPLYVVQNGVSYKDRIDITPYDIYHYTDTTGKIGSTSAVTIQDYLDLFTPLVQEGKKVIHISLSHYISSSYQNACIAAKEIGNQSVWVVDSLNLCTGSGMIALSACDYAKQGLTPEQVVQKLNEEIIPYVRMSFIIDRLDYLHKGGRCSSIARLGANLLKLKPCIEVNHGEMSVGKKYRGNLEKSTIAYVSDTMDNALFGRIFFVHTEEFDPSICEKVKKMIYEMNPELEVIEQTAGCVITNHCGPNTLGITFIQKKEKL